MNKNHSKFIFNLSVLSFYWRIIRKVDFCSVFNCVFTLNRPSTKIAKKHARKGACFFPKIACYRRIVWVPSTGPGEKHAPFSACFHVKGLFSMHVFSTNLWVRKTCTFSPKNMQRPHVRTWTVCPPWKQQHTKRTKNIHRMQNNNTTFA